MTDRYETISSLLQEALSVIPTSVMLNIRANGVNTKEMVKSKAAPGVFFSRTYDERLAEQYPVTPEMLKAYRQKVDAAIGEMMVLFPVLPTVDEARTLHDRNLYGADKFSLSEFGETMMPIAVMAAIIKRNAGFAISIGSKHPNIDKFFSSISSVCLGSLPLDR